MAGFAGKSNFYYNRRTTVEPPDVLLKSTPIGKWVYQALEAVKERVLLSDGKKHHTAYHLLHFFRDLNKFFLQDAAAMIAADETRGFHAIFSQLPVFQMDEWKTYCATMEDALANDECPLDAKLENVIPGLHQWHRANDQALKSVVETVNSHMAGLKETLSAIQDGQVVCVKKDEPIDGCDGPKGQRRPQGGRRVPPQGYDHRSNRLG
jgi:HPt (histidine-containing phosphotransfer) domain-containing protein